ncbi:substrate-binding domain-containing protein [Cellulomonas chengniuliangii]|uniref:substrate-binding domain-containing protein n=1 Tax=Cellulomonas chengniuliangii TaxID=2968084 RepID=UPI001D0DD74D|nr:substrate-binding domain-containing protein [Cellulomonas chengniuliangii]MCC2319027.1 substrate-binding domain-containing protein [Cellulomonas chengniuliangii]
MTALRARSWRAVAALAAGLIASPLAAAGCASSVSATEPTIAFLLPESKTARYENVDRPVFEQAVADECDRCRVVSANAGQDAERQQQQAESALSQGAGVLVLDAVDVSAALSIVAAAAQRGVPVIAYDRSLATADVAAYVSFDNEAVGRLQGLSIVQALGASAAGSDGAHGVLMVGGAATDANSAALLAGARAALDGAGVDILAEHSTPDWSPDKAQEWVAGQLTQYGGRVDAVWAANDGTASGAISAMKAAGLSPVPPVTGQDAELSAVQRILSGDQHMTVYKDIAEEARTAARLAVDVLRGDTPRTTTTVDGVPAVLLAPVAVTSENLRHVIVDGGVHTIEVICVDPYRHACVEAGLIEEGGE